MNKDFFDDYLNEPDEEETDEMHETKEKPKTFTKGFVTALAVCMVAIGAAVWTTVNNVNSYLNPTVTVTHSTDSDSLNVSLPPEPKTQEAQVNANVSGVKADSDTDKPVTFNCEPLKNRKILREYSEQLVYNETLGDYRAHTGIDFAADIDDKVRSMGQGVVTDIYYDDLLGNVVVIEHSDSVQSFYCGLAKTALVQKGDTVSAGDFVGTVYAIPGESAEEAHVHVGVKENGKWVNPQKFFKGKNE